MQSASTLFNHEGLKKEIEAAVDGLLKWLAYGETMLDKYEYDVRDARQLKADDLVGAAMTTHSEAALIQYMRVAIADNKTDVVAKVVGHQT